MGALIYAECLIHLKQPSEFMKHLTLDLRRVGIQMNLFTIIFKIIFKNLKKTAVKKHFIRKNLS